MKPFVGAYDAICPHCGGLNCGVIKNKKKSTKCTRCKRTFSLSVGKGAADIARSKQFPNKQP